MKKYRVAQVGVGGRGKVHANAFLNLSDRFEMVGLCDLDHQKLMNYSESKQLPDSILYDDADKMLSETRPDVFCFITQPTIRLELVQLAVKYKVKGLAFEKPMARSLEEALTITELCRHNDVKAIVSHQQKYLTSLQKVKEIVDDGEIGEVREVHGSSTANLTNLGTHYMDYVMWANGGERARWVIGHIHGTRELDHSHPSPDFFLARMEFENGVHGLLEIGVLSPKYMGKNAPTWLDNRLTVYGTHGYVWGDTDGRWGAFTRASKGEALTGSGPGYDPEKLGLGWEKQQSEFIQTPYLCDLAKWLDDDKAIHPCNVEISYHGFEVLSAACLSAIDNTRIDLPMPEPKLAADVFHRMKEAFKDVPLLAK